MSKLLKKLKQEITELKEAYTLVCTKLYQNKHTYTIFDDRLHIILSNVAQYKDYFLKQARKNLQTKENINA